MIVGPETFQECAACTKEVLDPLQPLEDFTPTTELWSPHQETRCEDPRARDSSRPTRRLSHGSAFMSGPAGGTAGGPATQGARVDGQPPTAVRMLRTCSSTWLIKMP